uniref:Uncharacterized protein n=1 Tax=Panagrolaimus davidi TaxID=227884 RepID=A0A914PCW6_9BILA
MLSYYPKLLKALMPILDIPPSTKVSRSQYDAIVENPLILHQLLYYKKQNIQSQEPKQISFFGGAFKGTNLNPFTGKSTCPPNFTMITMLIDLNICVSGDFGLKWPIRLGGFYHCESDVQICPKGYSSYLGTIINECEYFYCIRFANRQKISAPTLNRPPFIDYDLAFAEIQPTP